MDYSNKNNQSNSSISSNCSTSSDSRNPNGAMKRTNKYIDLQHHQVLGNYKNGSSNHQNSSSNCGGNYNISGIRMGTMSELWK